MSTFTNPEYLRDEQYRDDSNFRARFDLHQRFSTNPEPWQRWVFDRLDVPADAAVLEVGCGPGRLWSENLDRIPAGWRITLADLSPGMLDAARADLGDRVGYEVADVQELPFGDGTFDAVIANHMLYHVPNRRQALGEVARVLRRGGRLFAALNGRNHLRELDVLRTHRFHVELDLENAEPELAEFFHAIELERYPCDLEVTEPEPLLAFVGSSGFPPVEGAESIVAAEIDRRGSFHVTKSTGLFRCRKP